MTYPDETSVIKGAQLGPYARILTRDEDGRYAAEVLEFPGCFSSGDTPDEAMAHLDEAIEVWIGATLDEGAVVPPPMLHSEFSGRVTLRLLPSVHERASMLARLEGVSLNRLLSNAVSHYVGYLGGAHDAAPRRSASRDPPPSPRTHPRTRCRRPHYSSAVACCPRATTVSPSLPGP